MNLGLEGARVLVTAGASGIGLATAREFVREGARVHVCDVDARALAALSANDPTLSHSHCDVSDESSVRQLFDDTIARHGGLDVLVNNAGIAGPTARCEDIELADWERTFAVNLAGQFLCAKLAIPHLRKSRNASIINLSSAAGRFGFPLRTPYAASKWGVIGFTKSLSIELGGDRHSRQCNLSGLRGRPKDRFSLCQQGGRARSTDGNRARRSAGKDITREANSA